MKSLTGLLSSLVLCSTLIAQHHQHVSDHLIPVVEGVEPQPLLAQAVRLAEALSFIGNALPQEVSDQLLQLQSQAHTETTVQKIQELLDPFTLAFVNINPESRVKGLTRSR